MHKVSPHFSPHSVEATFSLYIDLDALCRVKTSLLMSAVKSGMKLTHAQLTGQPAQDDHLDMCFIQCPDSAIHHGPATGIRGALAPPSAPAEASAAPPGAALATGPAKATAGPGAALALKKPLVYSILHCSVKRTYYNAYIRTLYRVSNALIHT